MRTICTLILLLSGACLTAQETSYKQFTVKDGLPGSTVYHAVQDHKGFIWFATSQGVSRFDGRTFTNYTKEDGLPDNEILKLYVDRHNNIWFISLIGTPAVFTEGKIRRFDECKGVSAIMEDHFNDSIHLISSLQYLYGYYRSANKPGQWRFSAHLRLPVPLSTFKGRPILRASSAEGFNFYFYTIREQLIGVMLKNREITKSHTFNVHYFQRFFAFTRQSFFSLSEDRKKIVFVTPDTVYYADRHRFSRLFSLKDLRLNVGNGRRDDEVTSVFYENDSTLWLCTRISGLIRIQNFMQGNIRISSLFRDNFCTSLLKDKEGGYWVTTHNDGVYYLPNLDFHYLSGNGRLATKDVKSIKAVGPDRLVAGFADGNITRINAKGLTDSLYPTSPQFKNNRIMDLLPLPGRELIVGTDGGLFHYSLQGSRRLSTISIKGLFLDSDQNIVAASAQDVTIHKNGQRGEVLFIGRSTCVNGIGKKYYWGTMIGLYEWSAGKMRSLGNLYPPVAGIINHIGIAPDSTLWVSTQQGIAILKGNTLLQIRKENGLSSNMCKHILFDRQTAWVSTDQGISRIDFRWHGHKLDYDISNITEEDGLISNDVNQTAISGDNIWAATARGISYFSKQHVSHSNLLPRINITKVTAGQKEIYQADTVYLDHHNNQLAIELAAISYRSGKQIFYEYRFTNHDDRWHRVSNNTLEFSALPYGRYAVEVRAVDRWGRRSNVTQKLALINDPPFWRTTWFGMLSYLLTALVIGSLVYFYSRSRQQKKDKAYQLKKKIIDLEMMALRAQMNPHFIFNCLSSIQHHILRADPISANLYLHKFSSLIRKTLQRSASPTILLSEELSIISLYLELEQLRLEDRLEYRISYPGDILYDEVKIPSMIIQPYVENAIKHGIAPLTDEKGLLLVELKRTANRIDCRIEDNGIGIKAARKNRPAAVSYPSMGMSITESRIQTMNSIRQHHIKVQVTDKQDTDPAQRGTVVHLSFTINPYE